MSKASKLVIRGSVALLVAVGCNGGGSDGSGGTLTGWWQDPKAGACACPATAECKAGDCAALSIRGFTADGKYYEGIVAFSSSAGTMSTAGAMVAGTYAISGSQVRLVRPNLPDYSPSVQSNGAQMTFDGESMVHVAPSLAAALSGATSGGMVQWASYPVH